MLDSISLGDNLLSPVASHGSLWIFPLLPPAPHHTYSQWSASKTSKICTSLLCHFSHFFRKEISSAWLSYQQSLDGA